MAVGCHTNPTGQINIYGGDIEGVYTRTGITLKLAGAPVITNLTVATDVVANIDELATGAQISVKGDLGKVISNASDNAAAVKNCFTAAEGLDVDVNDQKQLVIVEATAAPEVDPFTDGFDPAGNNGQAYCEACYKQALAAGKTEEQALADSLQTWTVFEGGAISADGHYYLEQSYTGENAYNATRQFMTLEGKTVCFNLNGQSIMMAETAASGKSTRSMFRIQDGSTLNIMDADGTAEMTGFKNVTVGKYGGSVAELWNASNLNIYGGIFRLTEGQTAVSAIGCGTGDYAWTGTLNVYGGDIEGIYHRAGTVNLIGAPKITKLYAVGGATYNIDGLLPEAQIAVVGELDLVFTAASDNAAAVKNCFTAADDSLEVVVTTEGALALAEKQATQEPEVDPFTDGFDPANNNNMAHCEACYQQALAEGKSEQEALDASLKEWTVFTGGNTDPDMHYYLTENYENYSATSRFMSASQDGTICWNLNGHSVSMAPVENNDDAEALARADRTTLNIMDAKGTGVLTGYLHNKNAGTNGGSVVEAYQSGVVNIYGGTFLRDTTQSTNVAVGSRTGSKVYSGAINIYGGTIDGVYIRKTDNTTLTNYLAGAPVITGLDMTTGADINIDGLLPEAQISVKGSEGRVLTTASDNAAAVKGCFTSVNEGLVVDVNDQKQLVIVEAIAEPDPFTDGFDPAGNNGQAYCEACYKQALAEGKTEQEALDASLKTWTVYAGGAPTGDAHYYLAETVESYTAEDAYFMLFPKNAGYNICLNLNGKSIAMALDNKGIIVRGASTLNIMDAKGSGVLTGSAVSGTGANGGSVVEVRDTSVVNFYGGSFQRSTAEGAKGNDAVGSASGFTGAINVYGGTFDGIFVRASGAVNLINAPVINGLDMGNDAVVNIDGLTGGSIVLKDVTNEQVISNANATVANTVKGYFTVADEGLAVDVNSEGKLVIVEATPVYAAQNVVDWVEANKAAFRGEGKLVEGATVEAPCPFCSPETSVTWTGIVDSSSNLASGCHLYLIGDRNKAKGHNFLVGNTDEATECVYFNGFNVGNGENTSANRIRARGNLNIIAYGSTVTRSANCQASTSDYGTVMIQGGGTANFYGGTYINNDSRVNLIALTAGSHNLSFYDATLTDHSNGAVENKGTLNLYNCTLTGAEGKVTINNNIGSSSAIAGIVNVYGGTVNGDIVNMEGSVNVEGQDVPVAGQLNLYDNAVINGQLPTNGVNYPQQGNQEQEPSSQANKT